MSRTLLWMEVYYVTIAELVAEVGLVGDISQLYRKDLALTWSEDPLIHLPTSG